MTPGSDSRRRNAGKRGSDAGEQRRPEADTSRLFVVDRREGPIAVLVADNDSVVEMQASLLPASCRGEGAVVRVPLDAQGRPDWADATRDRAEEARRLAELKARAAGLRRSDPGGDVSL
jgi:hypothetical protein